MSAAIKGPLRCAATDAATTTAAVTAALKASPYQKNGSGSIQRPPRHAGEETSSAIELHLDGRAALERLVDDAVALGELEELVELVLWRVGVQIEAQANGRKTDRRILGDPERAAKVEV